jgi:(2Fe-2S) ferredoxin
MGFLTMIGKETETSREHTESGESSNREAAQCIWLARVRPEDCENIVQYTIQQGKVVKPDTQLRGGFDRCKQLASW